MEHTTKQKKWSNLAGPVAIVIAGALIAGAILIKQPEAKNLDVVKNIQNPTPTKQAGDLDQMAPVTSKDHVRGNINALVKIVEYSDTECPFCKRFHNTMKQVMDEYGKDGKVAWVYRHFPLDQLHPVKARKEAIAFECANEQGGNDKFWEYADRLYEVTPSNNGLDSTELPKIAQYIGLDVAKFNACLASTRYDKHIQDEVENAQATGGRGTPWSIVVGKDGKKYPLSGAQPLASIKQLIDLASK